MAFKYIQNSIQRVSHRTQSEGSKYYAVDEPLKYYQITELIADGSFSYVYKAKRKSYFSSHPVAVKFLNNISEFEERKRNTNPVLPPKLPTWSSGCKPDNATDLKEIKKEIRVLQSLKDGDYILRIHKAFFNVKKKEFWIVTSFNDYNLKQIVDRTENGLNFDQIKVIGSCVALALEFIHSKNIIHGDIKPSNVLISSNGSIQIGDFGSSKELHTTSKYTSDEIYRGTPAYSAPELFWSGNDCSRPVDIWAFACTLAAMRNKSSPFAKTRARPHKERSQDDVKWILNPNGLSSTDGVDYEYDDIFYLRYGMSDDKSCIDEDFQQTLDEVFDGEDYSYLFEPFDAEKKVVMGFVRTCVLMQMRNRPTIKEVLTQSFLASTVTRLRRSGNVSDSPADQQILRELVKGAKSWESDNPPLRTPGIFGRTDRFDFVHFPDIPDYTF